MEPWVHPMEPNPYGAQSEPTAGIRDTGIITIIDSP
jgi:hypothetical protein